MKEMTYRTIELQEETQFLTYPEDTTTQGYNKPPANYNPEYESVLTNCKDEQMSYSSDYPYEADKRSFLQKISLAHYANNSYVPKGGFDGYLRECKDQLMLTYKIYNDLKNLPYRGPRMNLTLNPRSKNLKI